MTTAPRRAVIIGIDDYVDVGINNLTGARNDAKEIHDRLTTAGNFQVEDDHLLLDGSASAQKIRKAISDLLWRTDESELSLLYFSGHGFTDAYGNGFIAPHDMMKSSPLVCGIRMQELRELMLAARNKKTVLLILDCCYSGIASDGDKAVTSASHATIEKCLAPLDDSKFQGTGRLILASSGSDERSREVADCQHRLGKQPPHPHGTFSFQVLEGLDGRASTEGLEITVGSLFKSVTDSFADSNEHQPRLYGSAASSLDSILLCRASRQADLAQRVQEVENLLADENDLFRLFRAIRNLEMVFSDSPGLKEALKARELIDHRLGMLRAPAVKVLLDNMLDLNEGCEATFLRLQTAVCRNNISFDTVAREELMLRNLILSLFLLAAGQTQLKVLQSQLAAAESKPSSKLSPSRDVSQSIGS
jgi:hypothetical protein